MEAETFNQASVEKSGTNKVKNSDKISDKNFGQNSDKKCYRNSGGAMPADVNA